MPWYRISAPELPSVRQHYAVSADIQSAVRSFFRCRYRDIPAGRMIRLSIYECADRWTGVDTRQPAHVESWFVENIFS